MHNTIKENDYRFFKNKLADISYDRDAKWHVVLVGVESLGVSRERHRSISEISLPQMLATIEQNVNIQSHCFIEETRTIILLCSENIQDVEAAITEISDFYEYSDEPGHFFLKDKTGIHSGSFQQALPYLEPMMETEVTEPLPAKVLLPPVEGPLRENYYTDKHSKNSQKPTVLSVDDEPHIHSLLRKTLGQEYHFIRAFNAESAIQQFLDQQPDVSILDMGLPSISGYDIAKWFKEVDPETAIIMLSSSQRREDRHACEMLGVNHYLSKPFQTTALKQAIETCVH
ncbi:MAG: response regulator [Rickettsiales bacterium]|nr:response regulator [Rickettsiales bacterium]